MSGCGRSLWSALGALLYKASPSVVAPLRSRERRPSSPSVLSPSPSLSSPVGPHFSTNMSSDQPAMDPTKMGVGRSIAVLTSGGDAQGKQRTEYIFMEFCFSNIIPPNVSGGGRSGVSHR